MTTVIPSIVVTEFARHARGAEPAAGVPNPPSGPIRPQTADEVADIIVAAIDHPVAEIYTQPVLPGIARRYLDDVEAFEAGSGVTDQSRRAEAPDGFAPSPAAVRRLSRQLTGRQIRNRSIEHPRRPFKKLDRLMRWFSIEPIR